MEYFNVSGLVRKTMKVTHVIIGLNIGGAELMLKRLIESHLDRPDIEHSVISLTDMGVLGEQLTKQGVPVYCLGMSSSMKGPVTFFKLRKLLKKLRPDAVQTWMYHSDFLGGLAARSVGIKRIFWNVRNTKLTGRGAANYIFRKICAFLSHLIPEKVVYVSSSAYVEHTSSGYAKGNAIIISNGFDVRKLSFNKNSRKEIRDHWKLADECFLVCSIGRYAAAKDHLTFIKAMKMAMAANSRVFAVIVGRGVSGSSVLRGEIDDFEDRFILSETRDDIPEVLSAADMFCLHSITEGFPNVLGEAMSVGLPCVTTRAGDAELILNNINLTCDVGDYKCISNKVLFLAEMTLSERQKFGVDNRNRIIDNYSLSSVIEKYLMLYNG